MSVVGCCAVWVFLWVMVWGDERAALMDLAEATQIAHWVNSSGWGAGEPCVEQWHGVGCTDRAVTWLALGSNNLNGSLPTSLHNLTFLTILDLSSNLLQGSVSVSLGLENLVEIDLSGNLFEMEYPEELFNRMSFLRILRMSRSGLYGPLPSTLSSLRQLTYLDLSFNSLNESLTSLPTSLMHIDVAQNRFFQVMPSFINFTQLTYLDLSSNNLDNLPTELPSSIRSLNLSWNSCFCGLNSNMFDSLTNLTYFSSAFNGQHDIPYIRSPVLTTLIASSNFLDKFPPNLLSLPSLPKLTYLDISSCFITGTIPPAFFANLSSIEVLNLGVNYFTGTIPPMDSMTHLKSLILYINYFQSTIPSDISHFLDLEQLLLTYTGVNGTIPDLGPLSKLIYLDLGSNKLQGTIPDMFGSWSQLASLYLSNNKLNGTFPPSWSALTSLVKLGLSGNNFTVISDVIGSLTFLQTLDLSANFLDGTVPPSFAQLTNLLNLYVNHNQFSSIPDVMCLPTLQTLVLSQNQIHQIPISFQKLSQVISLQLQYNNLTDLSDNIAFLTSLISLDISHNQINGTIPPSWSSLTHLIRLTLSYNFITVLPDTIGSLTSLIYLDLSYNILGTLPSLLRNPMLTDLILPYNRYTEIPEVIGHLTSLANLDLSHNLLEGTVPSSFKEITTQLKLQLSYNKFGNISDILGTISSLLTLDLSYNKISGSIPTTFISHTTLTALNLQNNILSGTIPEYLGTITSLQSLNLMNNKFSGTIPSSLFSLTRFYSIYLSGNTNLCDSLYAYCYQFIQKRFRCDISGLLSCPCYTYLSPPCVPSTCTVKYTLNMCLGNFSEFANYTDGKWIINSTMINLLNNFDVVGINGTITGSVNINNFKIQNSSISIQGNFTGSKNLTLVSSQLVVQENMIYNQATILLSSPNSNIQVQGIVNIDKSNIYLDLNNQRSNKDIVLLSSNSSFIGTPKFHIINQNPSDCSDIVFKNTTLAILLQYNDCASPINPVLVGSIVGGVVLLSLVIGIIGVIIRKKHFQSQIQTLRGKTIAP